MKSFLKVALCSLTFVLSHSALATYTAGSYSTPGGNYNCKIECTGPLGGIEYFTAELSPNGNVQCDSAHAPEGACAGRFIPGNGIVPMKPVRTPRKK
jgi:hypothetical protein